MQDWMNNDLREDLAAIDRFLTQMEMGRRRHPPRLLATRLLRIEGKLPAKMRPAHVITEAAMLVFEGRLDPLTETKLLRMAWASAVRLLAKAYGLRLVEAAPEADSRAA